MTISVWISFVIVAAMQTASPGPAVSLLISTGIQSGSRATLPLIPGFLLGDLTVILIAYAMITTLVSVADGLLDLIKIVGGSYLIFLGAKSIQRSLNPPTDSDHETKSFRHGFFISLLNPKGILFFATLLPQFISKESSFSFQFAILGATYLFVGLTTDMAYALASIRGSTFLTSKFRSRMVLASGVFLFTTGAFVLGKFALSL